MAGTTSVRAKRRTKSGFTLIELLVVVAILALLISMLVPSLVLATERAKISNCANVLHGIGNAMAQYVAANQDHMGPYCWYEPDVSNMTNDPQGYWWPYTYHCWLASYMGLGDGMPHKGANSVNYNKARHSEFTALQCPTGAKLGNGVSPYGVGPKCYYMQNAGWPSQNSGGINWPSIMAYFPSFKDTSQAVLLTERWRYFDMTSNADAGVQPYNTHYKIGKKGAMGVGRNILYADWRVKFWQIVDGDDKVTPAGAGVGWYCGSEFIPAATRTRGNEGSTNYFVGGQSFWDWWPILPWAG